MSDKELINDRWTYEFIEKSYDLDGKVTESKANVAFKRIFHIVRFDGQMVDKTRGTHELEGARQKKIVQLCNNKDIAHQELKFLRGGVS